MRYLWHNPKQLAIAVVFSFLGTLMGLLPAVLVGVIINGPIADGDKGELAWQLVLLIVLAAGGFLAMWYGGRVLAVAAQDAMYRLRREVFGTRRRCRCGSSTSSRSAI